MKVNLSVSANKTVNPDGKKTSRITATATVTRESITKYLLALVFGDTKASTEESKVLKASCDEWEKNLKEHHKGQKREG